MKNETIWILDDVLSLIENEKLDLEIDYKNPEFKLKKDVIRENIKLKSKKIKEIKDCIKWVKKQI